MYLIPKNKLISIKKFSSNYKGKLISFSTVEVNILSVVRQVYVNLLIFSSVSNHHNVSIQTKLREWIWRK